MDRVFAWNHVAAGSQEIAEFNGQTFRPLYPNDTDVRLAGWVEEQQNSDGIFGIHQ